MTDELRKVQMLDASKTVHVDVVYDNLTGDTGFVVDARLWCNARHMDRVSERKLCEYLGAAVKAALQGAVDKVRAGEMNYGKGKP